MKKQYQVWLTGAGNDIIADLDMEPAAHIFYVIAKALENGKARIESETTFPAKRDNVASFAKQEKPEPEIPQSNGPSMDSCKVPPVKPPRSQKPELSELDKSVQVSARTLPCRVKRALVAHGQTRLKVYSEGAPAQVLPIVFGTRGPISVRDVLKATNGLTERSVRSALRSMTKLGLTKRVSRGWYVAVDKPEGK